MNEVKKIFIALFISIMTLLVLVSLGDFHWLNQVKLLIFANKEAPFYLYAYPYKNLIALAIVFLFFTIVFIIGVKKKLFTQVIELEGAAFKALMNTSIDGLIVIDEKGAIVKFNLASEKIFGYQESEIVGENIKTLMPDEYANHHDEYLENYRKTGVKKIIGIGREVEIKNKNGGILDAEISISELTLDEKTFFVGTVRDITELKRRRKSAAEQRAKMSAVDKVQAIVEFDLRGNILTANQNFLDAMDYQIEEIQGKHHTMFVDEEFGKSKEYKQFWRELTSGKYITGEFKRYGRNGKEVWICASYNPIFNRNNEVVKIIKFANDVTKEKLINADYIGQLEAVNRSQAVIEFDLNGNILNANKNFLELTGYTLEEIKRLHHRVFIDKEYVNSDDYRNFWADLNDGKFKSGEFKRYDKHGKMFWIQASYNPIFDLNGKPYKVVKYASDITREKNNHKAMQDAIKKSEQKVKDLLLDLQLRIINYKDHVEAIASGDLTRDLMIEGDDDLADLGKNLDIMTKRLSDIARNIIHESNRLATGSNQLESTACSQAASAAEQASSVAQISSIVEEIKSTSQRTLEKVNSLGNSANRTSEEGEKGKAAVSKMKLSMQDLQDKMDQIAKTILGLSDKTQQIGEITEAVADIAKQSKMLALNASVEAAKAGESGKGFAVVASEVKELAEQSQKSTERVKKILQDIRNTSEHAVMVTEDGTKSVDANLKQVDLTGEVMASLGNVIEEAVISSEQISAAVREESIAIEQVVCSVQEIDKVTNQFSTATEQTKSATLALTNISTSLIDSISIYKTKDQD